jgi:hypothetical protein
VLFSVLYTHLHNKDRLHRTHTLPVSRTVCITETDPGIVAAATEVARQSRLATITTTTTLAVVQVQSMVPMTLPLPNLLRITPQTLTAVEAEAVAAVVATTTASVLLLLLTHPRQTSL